LVCPNRVCNLQRIRTAIVATVVKTIGVWYVIGTQVERGFEPAPPAEHYVLLQCVGAMKITIFDDLDVPNLFATRSQVPYVSKTFGL
jgi:hypothetical protein